MTSHVAVSGASGTGGAAPGSAGLYQNISSSQSNARVTTARRSSVLARIALALALGLRALSWRPPCVAGANSGFERFYAILCSKVPKNETCARESTRLVKFTPVSRKTLPHSLHGPASRRWCGLWRCGGGGCMQRTPRRVNAQSSHVSATRFGDGKAGRRRRGRQFPAP